MPAACEAKKEQPGHISQSSSPVPRQVRVPQAPVNTERRVSTPPPHDWTVMVPLAEGVYTYQSPLMVEPTPQQAPSKPAPVEGPSAKWVPGLIDTAVPQL